MEAAALASAAPKYTGFALLFVIFSIIAIIICEVISIIVMAPDWASIRCVPYVMPFAGLFGQNVNDNFKFCMSEAFNRQAGETIAPLYKFFGGFTSVLSSLIDSTNSIRLGFATFMGGFVTIMSEFNDRFRMFMSQVNLSAQRLKMLMYRIYATFYAMIYMALSSIRAVNNFGGTVLFGFLDTFCFDPDTPIHVKGRGSIRIADVKVGDILEGGSGGGSGGSGSRVKSTFRFMADGQPMVYLGKGCDGPAVLVSTNHYVSHMGTWIRAGDHPDAFPAPLWNGGSARPLICFNTDDNQIPVGGYIFKDYDETPEGVNEAIRWTAASLNGGPKAVDAARPRKWKECIPAFEPGVKIFKRDGGISIASELRLGDVLRPTGDIVTGVIDTEVTEYIEMPDGKFTPGTLFWHEPSGTWQRLGDIYPNSIQVSEHPLMFRSLIVLSGSRIECKSGMIIRDYMEVASPWAEEPYAKAITGDAPAQQAN